MRKRRILVVTPFPLLPADSGGRLHALSCSRFVPAETELHLLALANAAEKRELDAGGEALRTAYGRVFRSVQFVDRPPIPAELTSAVKQLRHFVEHAALRLPLMDVSYFSRDAVRLARQIVRAEQIDLLEVHQLQCAFYRRFLEDLPAILVNHNLEHLVYPFWPASRGGALQRRLWDGFAETSRRNSRAIEVENAFAFDAKLFISPRDLELVPAGPCPRLLLPFGVDLDERPKTFHADRFVAIWIGGFFWPPNLDAAHWLVDEIWPRVRAGARGPVELHLIGSHPPEELRSRHDGESIFVHGHVANVDAFRRDADVLLAPIRSGGGIRIKIIEALNAGLPVVATSKGAEGIAVEDGVDIALADDPDSLARAILELEGSTELRERRAVAGRSTVALHHSPASVAGVKRQVYEEVR